jgi:hypothetical protein
MVCDSQRRLFSLHCRHCIRAASPIDRLGRPPTTLPGTARTRTDPAYEKYPMIGSNGLALDRLIATWRAFVGADRAECIPCFADSYEGKRFGGPNDVVVKRERRDLFHRHVTACAFVRDHALAPFRAANCASRVRPSLPILGIQKQPLRHVHLGNGRTEMNKISLAGTLRSWLSAEHRHEQPGSSLIIRYTDPSHHSLWNLELEHDEILPDKFSSRTWPSSTVNEPKILEADCSPGNRPCPPP